MKKNLAIIFIAIILPSILFAQTVFASVVFSEIAWMGGLNSSTDEWIELYNNGTADVVVDNYVIESESKKISIKLSGSIIAGGYYLIERTDDNSVPNIPADLIATFGNGLSNAGDNMYLKNSDGQVIDSVLFSSGWPAGDNTSKQTMQKISGSWTTADATPKKSPTDFSITNSTSTNTDPKNSTQNPVSGSTYVPPKNQSRFIISTMGDQLVSVPTIIEIDNRDDAGNKIIYGGIYRINFGDGVEKDFKIGEPVEHIYEYAGSYRITVKFIDSTWVTIPRKQAFLNLQIEEPLISIDGTHVPTLVIKNKGTKDIDLGNFVFTAGSKSFNPPSESIIFAGKDIWLSPSVTGFTADDFVNLSVKSKSGQQVTSYSGSKKTAITLVSKINTDPRLINKLLSKNDLANESFVQENPNKLINNDFNTFNSLNSASAGESGMSLKQKPNNLIIWFLFGALVLVGSFIFIKLRSVEIKEADEFTLLEE